MNNYYMSVLPGLADVAAEELSTRLGVKVGKLGRLRNAELLSVRVVSPEAVFDLKTVEDVFANLGTLKLSGRSEDLKMLSKSPVVAKLWGKTLSGHERFRVVAQADDVAWRNYRRVDMQEAVEAAILRLHPGWRLEREAAPVEIWLQQMDRQLVVGLRLTTGVERQRGGRSVERKAALRPSVAAAMVFLTSPEPEDVFLDPMCGTGTILLERALASRYEMLLGGDIDSAAVKAALANFGPRHQPRRIERWDATSLPLEDNSVNKIACNLPWGRQIGEKNELPRSYADLLKETVRVLSPGGCMVLLTSEWDVLKRAIGQRPELALRRSVPNVEILGRRADIFVLERL